MAAPVQPYITPYRNEFSYVFGIQKATMTAWHGLHEIQRPEKKTMLLSPSDLDKTMAFKVIRIS